MLIIGVGLPRTATNSLSACLRLLDMEGRCKCILNNYLNHHKKEKSNSEYSYIIENDFFKNVSSLRNPEMIKTNKFILTTRSSKDWHASLSKLEDLDEINKDELFLLKCVDIDLYQKEIRQLFEEANCLDNLLIINIFDTSPEMLWQQIEQFLNLEYKGNKSIFPSVNLNLSNK